MPKAKSEYEVEELYIDRLDDMGYEYIDMKNYDDVCSNFRKQFCKLNAKELIAAKGVAELSDAAFDRVMIRLENIPFTNPQRYCVSSGCWNSTTGRPCMSCSSPAMRRGIHIRLPIR